MDIVVASKNPAKLRAVDLAFAAAFPDGSPVVRGLSVASGVSDQPLSDDETRSGSWNRARGARNLAPDADFWIGLEGGLERIDDAWMGSAWMVVIAADGRTGQARTPTLPLPPPVQELLDEGYELGVANDLVFDTHNSKQAGGAYGLLTDGRLTRGGVYSQAITLALLPVLHELWATPG